MSPKPRRAQQEVPLATTTTTTTTTTSTAATGATTPAPPTNIEPEPEDVKVEEEFKKEVEEDIDADMKENEEFVNEEAAEKPEVTSEGAIPDGDSEKAVEECPSTTEPLPEGEPSVASQLMSGEGEGDGLSMEGLVMSEDEREGRCDKVTEQVHKA